MSAPSIAAIRHRVAAHHGLEDADMLSGHCQTNWMGPVEPTIEGSQAAS